MEVILLDKVQNLGTVGDRVKVRSGYGRNFLVPQGKAVYATAENVKKFDADRAVHEQKSRDLLLSAKSRAEQLATLRVEIRCKAGDEGKLYGSVGPRDVAIEVSNAGVSLNKSEVRMPTGPLRALGEFDIAVQLHPDVTTTVKVAVLPE